VLLPLLLQKELSLNLESNIMAMAYAFDKNNNGQMIAHAFLADTNTNIFLTGKAGTGKTAFLKYAQDTINKNFVVLAPTGIAAIAAGGQTIRSFFGLPLKAYDVGTIGTPSQSKILNLLHTDTIIIDEVSKVRCDIIDAIDCTLRKIMRNELPFGGKQMVFVGGISCRQWLATKPNANSCMRYMEQILSIFTKRKCWNVQIL